jgi:hypothetical protein
MVFIGKTPLVLIECDDASPSLSRERIAEGLHGIWTHSPQRSDEHRRSASRLVREPEAAT